MGRIYADLFTQVTRFICNARSVTGMQPLPGPPYYYPQQLGVQHLQQLQQLQQLHKLRQLGSGGLSPSASPWLIGLESLSSTTTGAKECPCQSLLMRTYVNFSWFESTPMCSITVFGVLQLVASISPAPSG